MRNKSPGKRTVISKLQRTEHDDDAGIPAFRNGRQTGIFSIPECMHFMENAPHREYNKISSCHLKPCRHDLLKTAKHNTYLPAGRLRVNACPGTCNQCT